MQLGINLREALFFIFNIRTFVKDAILDVLII